MPLVITKHSRFTDSRSKANAHTRMIGNIRPHEHERVRRPVIVGAPGRSEMLFQRAFRSAVNHCASGKLLAVAEVATNNLLAESSMIDRRKTCFSTKKKSAVDLSYRNVTRNTAIFVHRPSIGSLAKLIICQNSFNRVYLSCIYRSRTTVSTQQAHSLVAAAKK